MKTLSLTVISLACSFASALLAQNEHIPPCYASGGHIASICYGYATARAFNRGWNSSPCSASDLYLEFIDPNYFELYNFSYGAVQIGDIIRYSDHAVYVVYKWGASAQSILVDHVPYEGANEQTFVYLSTINANYGNPTGIYRKKAQWRVKVQNDFTGGKVGFATYGSIQEYPSPFTSAAFHWESLIQIDAVMHEREHDGVIKLFYEWVEGPLEEYLSSSKYNRLQFYRV